MGKVQRPPPFGNDNRQLREFSESEIRLGVRRQPEQHLIGRELEGPGMTARRRFRFVLDIDKVSPALPATGLQNDVYMASVALL